MGEVSSTSESGPYTPTDIVSPGTDERALHSWERSGDCSSPDDRDGPKKVGKRGRPWGSFRSDMP